MSKSLYIALSTCFLMGCASTKFFIPANRFMIPETGGGLGLGEASGGGVGVIGVEITPNMNVASPDTTPELSKNSALSTGLQLGLFSFIDLYYNVAVGAPAAAGLKIQLLGDPKRTAKAGNFSLAVAGGGVFGDSKQTSSSTSSKASSELDFKGWEGMALIGYRPSDIVLFYAGPFQTHVEADIKISRTILSSGVTTVTSEPNGEGDVKGVTVGMRIGYHFFFNLEVSKTETVWTRNEPTILASEKFENVALGISLGGAW